MINRRTFVEKTGLHLHGLVDKIVDSLNESNVYATRELLIKGKKAFDEVINQIKIDDDR